MAHFLEQRRQMGPYLEHLAQGSQQRHRSRIAAAYGAAGISQAQLQDGGVHSACKLALCEDCVNVDLLQQSCHGCQTVEVDRLCNSHRTSTPIDNSSFCAPCTAGGERTVAGPGWRSAGPSEASCHACSWLVL